MTGCQIGSLTYDYAYLLKNGRKEADSLLCKLSWLVTAKPIIDAYIPVGTLISSAGQNACGLTNSDVGFAPDPDPPLTFDVTLFDYNGNPLIPPASETSITDTMDDIVAALTADSGVQWSYTQISTYEFLLCAPYTQNGDTVDINITVSAGEPIIGTIRMAVELENGVAPAEAEYQTDALNCNITEAMYNSMVETADWITCGVGCSDIAKPTPEVCESDNPSESNIELREESDLEEREDGN